MPTPSTQELLWLVTKVALGEPEAELAEATAPIAPDPLVPDELTPVKVTTVIEEATVCERVALTVTLARGEGANARQISAVPNCAFVRMTKTQVRPAPVTLFTCTALPKLSLEMNASSNSFAAVVEKALVVTTVLAAARSPDAVASIEMAAFEIPQNVRRISASRKTFDMIPPFLLLHSTLDLIL